MWVTANVGERRICRLKSFYLLLPKSKAKNVTGHMICAVNHTSYAFVHKIIFPLSTQNIINYLRKGKELETDPMLAGLTDHFLFSHVRVNSTL